MERAHYNEGIVKIVKIMIKPSLFVCLVSLFCNANVLFADSIHVAVASNFSQPIKQIAKRFEANTHHQVILIIGSTGKQYAQIINGAPFDAFFSADVKHPKLLEDKGVAIRGSRFSYAIGKIVLWSPKPNFVDKEGKVLNGKTLNGKILDKGAFRHIALANPKLAPYGRAARQVLQGRGLWDLFQQNDQKQDVKIVRGENIAQTFQFVKSGNAELGFVAYSQIKHPYKSVEGSYWEIPQSLYDPIEQQAVLLKDNKVAREFLNFVQSPEASNIITSFGYDVVSVDDVVNKEAVVKNVD